MEHTYYEYLEEILNSKNVCDHLTGYQAMTIDALVELLSFCSYERLCELAQADREGRCVVLPCKQGDVLWTFCNHQKQKVYSFKVTDLSTLNGRTVLNTDILSVVDARDIGKTVFLTREDAEAALKGEQDG